MYIMNRNNNIDPYLQQKVMTASPTELVVYLYDIGISSCIKKDKIKLSKLLSHLKESLDYSPQTEKLSYLFASVYDHISFLVRNDKFDEAKSSFSDIKTTWKQAHNLR